MKFNVGDNFKHAVEEPKFPVGSQLIHRYSTLGWAYPKLVTVKAHTRYGYKLRDKPRTVDGSGVYKYDYVERMFELVTGDHYLLEDDRPR